MTTTGEEDEQTVEGDQEEVAASHAASPRTKLAVYLELVQLAQEQSATLWIDPRYQGKYETQLALTVGEARSLGLGEGEIAAAIIIGHTRAQMQKQLAQSRV